MPALQQLPMSLPSSPTDCGTPDSTNSSSCDTEPLNILHTHSINSIHSLLLDQAYISDNEVISSTTLNNKAAKGHGHGQGGQQANETMSITDLLGLNSPRGTLLGNTFNNTSDGYFSNTTRNYHQDNKQQSNRDEFNYGLSLNNPLKNGNRTEQISAYTPPSPPAFINSRIARNSTAQFNNDVSSTVGNNNNNINNNTIDSSFFLSNSSSRSNSPADSDTSLISNMENINELMSSLALNINNQIPAAALNSAALNAALNSNNPLAAAATANFLNGVTELELTNLQNLQAIHAIKYLQQPPVVLGSLLQYSPACSRNNQWNGTAASILSNLSQQTQTETSQNIALDRAARFHRNSASLYDATCTWSGVLPQRTQKPTGFSSKVFLGGVPWDISEQLLVQTFKQFGSIKVEWPGKEKQACQPKGYVYIIFESEKQVRSLLQSCTHDYVNGGSWFFKISSKRMKSKEAQVIPWIINDSNFVKSTSHKLDPSKTVFVGALHGMLTAEGLAKIMNDLFEGVIYAGIDTDKYKYPIGSGRVTFNNNRSYMKAVTAAFIEIKTTKFTKKVQVDPYLEDSLCSFCAVQQGPYFCRELLCFRYFCRPCWQLQHTQDAFRTHKPLMRNSKTQTIVGLNVEQSQQQQQQQLPQPQQQQQQLQRQQSHSVQSQDQLFWSSQHSHNN